MADGQVIFEISADGKKAIADIKDITRAIDNESKKWDSDAKQSTTNIENSFASMAKKVVAGLSLAKVGQILLSWGKDAIQASSDLREVQNVVDVTFGESASVIEKWAKSAGEQFGLTETQAKKFTSTLGAMAKSAGMNSNEIVQMTTDLAGLSADMASFYNLDFEEAFAKIRSGLSGQTMPLKELGINMSVANLEAFALEKGITKAFDAMSQSEQIMLRYQYLMQATSDAQGDFIRTSDGYANASRRVETAMNTIKTKGGDLLLNVIEPLTSGIASFLEQITKEPEHTVLDEFANINLDTEQKMKSLNETYNKASDIIKVIDQIQTDTIKLKDGSTITFEELFKDIGNVEKNGGDVQKYIESLTDDVDEVNQKYQMWKESTRQLTSLVPSLSNVIDGETNSINGGTEALQKNLDEWKATQEKKIAWSAYYAKKEALATSEASIWQLRLDVVGKEQAKKRIRKSLEDIGTVFDEEGKIDTSKVWFDASKVAEGFDINDFIDLGAEYEKAVREETEATEKYTNALKDNKTAEQELEDIHTGLIEEYGDEEEALKDVADTTMEYLGKTDSEWKDLTASVQESIKALSDYVQGVRDATESSVNSTLKGFSKVKTASKQYEEQANKAKELAEELRKTGKYTEREIEIKVNAENAQQTLNGINEALKSQLEFIKEYQDNLELAKKLGVSDDVLAMLSDGSNESALQLHAITEAYKEWDGEGVPEDIKELNDLFAQVSDSKGKFTDTLTQNKLTVDKTYQEMVEKAKSSIAEMNLEAEASEATSQTMQGLIAGITSNVDGVGTAVDAILSELNRLSGWGININLGAFGSFGFSLDGSHETGLDRVPFDHYLAELHEGEGILTAEENRIWQNFKHGDRSSRNIDYDALGGVVRDNVHAGGNVYLDGRTVGKVMSDIQGNQYRTMKRSGFQQ